jgi:hypothetical protein
MSTLTRPTLGDLPEIDQFIGALKESIDFFAEIFA